jgi:hypothetical protein
MLPAFQPVGHLIKFSCQIEPQLFQIAVVRFLGIFFAFPRVSGACSVATIDLHSSQTISAASRGFLSFAGSTSKIIRCVLSQVGQ